MKRLIAGTSPWEKTVGYSRAVVQGGWCFVSGTTGIDPATGKAPASAADQTRIAFAIISGALEQAGFAIEDVVRVQYTVTDRAYLDEIIPELGAVFCEIRPAATMVFADLIHPDLKIEIEVTALRS